MSAILVLLTALALEPQVAAEPLDASRHMLDMETEARSSFEAAQAALVPTARRLCAERTFFLGAFKFAEPPEARNTFFTWFVQGVESRCMTASERNTPLEELCDVDPAAKEVSIHCRTISEALPESSRPRF